MPEQQPTEAETVETTAEAPDTTDVTPEKPTPKPAETVDFWKAKAREQEKRAKENAAKADEFDKAVEAQKTEQQRLIERAETAERRAAELETAQEIADWKKQVADDPKYAGITAEVLRGSTLEEIVDHAASLKALLPEPRKAGQVLTEGRTVNAGNNDPAQQFANIITNARRG